MNFLNHSNNMTHAREGILWMFWEILKLEKSVIVEMQRHVDKNVGMTCVWFLKGSGSNRSKIKISFYLLKC